MINKYDKFFENFQLTLSYDKAYSLLISEIREAQEYLKENVGDSFEKNYTKIAPLYAKSDADKDFKIANDYMTKKGWSFEKIQELKKYIPNLSEKICKNYNLSESGGFDYYLYKITDGKWELSGGDAFDATDEEYIVKFSYGYHKTKYGKLIIDQYVGMDKYYKGVNNYFIKYPGKLIETIVGFISSYISNNVNPGVYEYIPFSDITAMKSEVEMYDEEKNEIYVDLVALKSHISISEVTKLSQDEFDKIVLSAFEESKLPAKLMSRGDLKIQLGKYKN